MLLVFTGNSSVSTHSRPKAAGRPAAPLPVAGLVSTHSRPKAAGIRQEEHFLKDRVSTHSRPKAAGAFDKWIWVSIDCFNTQPPEGGWISYDNFGLPIGDVSTHSRPKAAGRNQTRSIQSLRFQHTAARRRLGVVLVELADFFLFQHTAARRRLVDQGLLCLSCIIVSTHSRPKAAGRGATAQNRQSRRFNTQPPEGGWHFS